MNHAKNLTAGDGPRIVDVYGLQELAEVHCYLKTVHQFSPAEVEALLQFADPMEAADLCWQENPHEYSFPICELLQETDARKRLPLAEPELPGKPSVKEQLRAAMQETHQRQPQEGRPQRQPDTPNL